MFAGVRSTRSAHSGSPPEMSTRIRCLPVPRMRREEKKKRGKKFMQEFRAEESTSAIFLSPKNVRQALELQEQREQAKEQQQLEKEQRAADIGMQKALKEQEAQQKRTDRSLAAQRRKPEAAQKKADRLRIGQKRIRRLKNSLNCSLTHKQDLDGQYHQSKQ